ncbi:MAG: site-2 protease family protein [Planctomycetes bacterium]|nr:site-2 protease family protein [Planctomycetota bacterium]
MEAPLETRRERKPAPAAQPGILAGAIRIGRIAGLDIRVDASWFIIAALVASSLLMYFVARLPNLPLAHYWIASIAATLLFFGSILIHEFSHSLVARSRGLEVHGITLFVFGGVSLLRGEPRRPGEEFAIAIVGPLTSAVLAAVFLAASMNFSSGSLAWEGARWLAFINFALAVFNLLPGFPLDGGRVFRAVAWKITGNLRRATRVAAQVGAAIAYGLVALGVLQILLTGQFLGGLWLGLIGLFLLSAAHRSVEQVELREALSRLRVEQAMRAGCPEISPDVTVQHFVDDYVFKGGERCFFVAENGILQGLLTLQDVRKAPRAQWPSALVKDIMVPFESVRSVAPSDSLFDAFEKMNQEGLNQLPVIEDRVLKGMLTRNDVFRLMGLYLEISPSGGPQEPGA